MPLNATRACLRGAGDACRADGWASLRRATPGGDADAALFFMQACEMNDPQGCVDLGALYAIGRGVRRDDARACTLGLAEACARAGLPSPAGAGVPSAAVQPVPDPAHDDSAELRKERVETGLLYAKYYLWEMLHEPLGFTRAALVASPPAPWEDTVRANDLMMWRPSPNRCVPVYRFPDGRKQPGIVWASLVLGLDGRVWDVRAKAQLGTPDADAQERCVAERMTGWEFPIPRFGGRIPIRIEGRGPERDTTYHVTAADEPIFARTGDSPPREKKPGCIRNAFHPTADSVRWVSGEVRAMFAVARSGAISRFRMITAIPDLNIAKAIDEAVHACEWVPGRDAAGELVPMWFVLMIDFGEPEADRKTASPPKRP